MKKLSKSFIVGIVLLVLFAVFTAIVKFVDVSNIGPLDSSVGLAHLNKAAFNFFGVSNVWYYITEILGILALLVAAAFAILGFVQLIKNKSIKSIDYKLLILAVFYVLVALIYFVFEFAIINYRPILVEGVLEASYPSSHTMLTVFILGSAMILYRSLFADKKILRFVLDVISFSIMGFVVIGRLLAGMHWLTDIIAGLLVSVSLIFIYYAVIKFVEFKIYVKQQEKEKEKDS